MPISNQLLDGFEEADVIIVGGGTAACVIAGRLASADPGLTILVIEGGQDNYNNENVVDPARFHEHLQPGGTTAIFYHAKSTKELADKGRIIPAGGLLGGGSSMNLSLYSRAQRSDFDSWKTPGWSANDLIPYLKKLESYHGNGNEKTHGYDGPVHVSDGGYTSLKSESDFIDACAELGYPEKNDMQNLDSNNGTQRWMRHITQDGRRQDTAHTYLHPLLRDGQHLNLHVLTETKAVRVLFDKHKKATGVEFTPNPHYQKEGVPAKTSVKARRLVVVAAGSCGTPVILERSGIGAESVLKPAGVPLIEDLPGVGNNYQDHNLSIHPYRASFEPEGAVDGVLRWDTCDVSARIRPTDAEVAALDSNFQKAWNCDFKHNENRPLMLMTMVSKHLGDPREAPPGQCISVLTYTAYPYSRGHIHITGPAWDDPLDFDMGFFTDQHDVDLKKQIWVYKKHREIMRRCRMYRGEFETGHPKFSAHSPAACCTLDRALRDSGAVENLSYSQEDDNAIEQFLRENIQPTWHQLGTAKMGPREENGVVDANLNVYGVKNLKLADLSIVPENVGANTMNTAMVIGEKAADIIIKDLGLGSNSLTINGVNSDGITNGHH